MRTLLVILAAAVTAGLVGFFSFNWLGAFGLQMQSVLVPIDVFVGFIACLTLLSGAIALGYRGLLVRGDQSTLRELKDRVARLEAGGRPQLERAPS